MEKDTNQEISKMGSQGWGVGGGTRDVITLAAKTMSKRDMHQK